MTEGKHCLCGFDQAKPLFTKRGFKYVRCLACGLVYISNPKLDNLDQFYEDCSTSYYLQDARLDLDAQEDHARELSKIESGLDTIMPINLLDVGCGNGSFLLSAQKRGYTVLGVEYSLSSAEFVRSKLGIDVVTSDFLDMPKPQLCFDVVVMRQVLEHLPDPEAHIQKAYSFLKMGGLLYLAVPNYNSLSKLIRGSNHWIFNSSHLYYFTATTLKDLLRRTGFSVINCETSLGGMRAPKLVRVALKLTWPLLHRFNGGGVLETLSRKCEDLG